jgi:hypothetical protein
MEPTYKIFAKYGWSDIYYANPFLPNDDPQCDEPNRWHVGVRTGPGNNVICVKQCTTEEEANKYRSPAGNSINEALTKAIRLYKELTPGSDISSCRKKKPIGQ